MSGFGCAGRCSSLIPWACRMRRSIPTGLEARSLSIDVTRLVGLHGDRDLHLFGLSHHYTTMNGPVCCDSCCEGGASARSSRRCVWTDVAVGGAWSSTSIGNISRALLPQLGSRECLWQQPIAGGMNSSAGDADVGRESGSMGVRLLK